MDQSKIKRTWTRKSKRNYQNKCQENKHGQVPKPVKRPETWTINMNEYQTMDKNKKKEKKLTINMNEYQTMDKK